MKNNRIKKAMACLLCIVVLMSSSCAMAGRVDAQAPFLVEDHAVPTTSEFDITAEETEAEIMLLQEEAESEPEASSDVEPAEEESAPEEDAAPAEDEGSQDADTQEPSSENEQEDVSDDNQAPAEDGTSEDTLTDTPDETPEVPENPDQTPSGDETTTPDGDSTETPDNENPDDVQPPADDTTSGDILDGENNGDQSEENPDTDDATTDDGSQTPDDDASADSNDNSTGGDTVNPDDTMTDTQPENPDQNQPDNPQENPDTENPDNSQINPDGELEGDVTEEVECALTEEEQKQVEEVIALIEALPTMEEITARFEELEEDGDAYATYYQELYAQVNAAQEAYNALTDAQKEAVTNAEVLEQFEWLLANTLEENGMMGPDEAYVKDITIEKVETGTGDFDVTEGLGNDTAAEDDIVRTFDTVNYQFKVNMISWNSSTTYERARVKLEFVLPLTESEGVFDQANMAWMDQTEGYKPELTTTTRTIDGKEKECQVLTCYKFLEPAEGSTSVVPGNFGENLTVYVKSMKNGETFAPIISAAMEGGTWDGPCKNEEHTENGEAAIEKKTVIPEPVTITAAPKYNIKLDSETSYSDIFDFQGNEAWMAEYGEKAANTDIENPIPGRLMKLGITLQLYNDNAAKGLKGIEFPEGPISFDLELLSQYTPTSTSEQGTQIDTTEDYMPLLWSYGENREIRYGEQNTDGRVIKDQRACLELAPYFEHNEDREGSDCWDSGTWNAVQEGKTIHITVSDYEINLDHMPIKNFPTGKEQLYFANVGCFSSGGIWLIQPFNKKISETAPEGPEYDVIKDHGAGAFATTVKATNLEATTVSGTKTSTQMVTDDDEEVRTLELNLPGSMQNRVRYAGNHDNWWFGSGVESTVDGNDYAAVGSELYLVGGFSYGSNKNEDNQLYLGTNLIRFYGSAIELEGEGVSRLMDGASLAQIEPYYRGEDEQGNKKPVPSIDYGWWEPDPIKENIRVYYATKTDGTDWKDDEELKHTYEDDLIFYESLEAIPEGHLCVGILTCFVGPGPEPTTENDEGSYYYYHYAKVRDDWNLAGKSFALVSTSRVWSKKMFDDADRSLEDINLGKENEVNIRDWIVDSEMLSDNHYRSANIEGSTWYNRETYKEDGSGPVGTHNSEYEHWGDTLLVIGYKTFITKNLMQMVDGQAKNNFNLDYGQRTVDFRLQPRTAYEKENVDYEHKTTITVVDTLPEYMTYKPGSAYFGGVYQQAPGNGGIQGTIIYDENKNAPFRAPVLTEPKVTKNENGTETLTWEIPNTIGEPMAPIYYSAEIGSKGNPENDVPIGTTKDLTNVAYITAPYDLRDPLNTSDKHSKAGISVNRGSADSFGKYTEQKVVEEDGEIDYVVYFNNNAETSANVFLVDTMPADKVSGSHFTGTYRFAGWKLDERNTCDVEKLEIYYTFNEEYKDMTAQSKDNDGKNILTEESVKSSWTKATIKDNGTIDIPTQNGSAHPVAWAVIGTLDAKKSVYIDLKIKLDPGASEVDRDNTDYNYFVNRLSTKDTTITTENPTLRRTLEGVTWWDYNRDGIQANVTNEPQMPGVKVELLKLIEGETSTEEAHYENVCYPGTTTPIVIETGEQISVRANAPTEGKTEAKPYSEGAYKFLDLPPGTFAVRFTDGSREITKLNATKSNQGENDKIDSDGIPTLDTDGKLQKTVILNIGMPRAEEMNTVLYESKHHDSGFYPDTWMAVQKVEVKVDENGEKTLAGAVFTIQNDKGETLSFTVEDDGYYLKGYGKKGGNAEVKETQELSVDSDGRLNIHNLLPGTYTLTEVVAPEGYTLLREPVSFVLTTKETQSTIELKFSEEQGQKHLVSLLTENNNGIGLKVENEKLYELPEAGGIGTYWYTISGTLLMLAGVLILYKKKYAGRC